MNRKALFTGLVIFLVVFAVLPAANATVLDPSGCPAGNSTAVKNLYAQYNSSYKICNYGLITDSLIKKYNVGLNKSKLDNILKNKPVSNLTWNEAYYLADMYSVSNSANQYPLSRYNRDADYANKMIQEENTPQSRALAYIVMSGAADSMYNSHTNHPTPIWNQKETYYIVMMLQNNPNGKVNNGDPFFLNSSWWDGVGLSSLRQWRGYNIPQKAIDFTHKAEDAALAGKLNTQAQLRQIGFYTWKKKYLIPIVTQKAPQENVHTNIADTIPIIQNFLSRYGSDMAKGIGGIFILGIVLLVLKRRRENRYY